MSVDLHYRDAQPADAARLGEFMTANFLAAYGHCSTPENVAAAVASYYGTQAQVRQLADPQRSGLIALLDDRWAGHAQVRKGGPTPPAIDPDGAIELTRFYVDAPLHGTGVAQAMMAQVRSRARALGGRSLYLSVWQQQPQAIRFYTREGFRIVGEAIFMIGEHATDDWLMLAPLD